MEEEEANHPPSPQQHHHCITQYISNEEDGHTSHPPSSPEDDRSINLSAVPNDHRPPSLPPPHTTTTNPVVSPSATTGPPPSKPPPSSSSSSSTEKNTDWTISYNSTKSSVTKPRAKRRTNRHQFHKKIVVGSRVRKRIGAFLENERDKAGRRKRDFVYGTVMKAAPGNTKQKWEVVFDNGYTLQYNSAALQHVHNDFMHQNVLKTNVSFIHIFLDLLIFLSLSSYSSY